MRLQEKWLLYKGISVKSGNKIIGNHPEIRNIRRRIRRAALQNRAVLIIGEAGTEKDIIAWEIHRRSRRNAGIFVVLDCYQLHDPDVSAARFLFRDSLEKARGGTVFLDNIEVMPAAFQDDFYRLLTAKRRAPHGKLPLDVRVISASAGRLNVRGRSFNPHLALLLSQYMITIVPVRRRKSDLPLLFEHFYKHAAEERGYKEPPAVPETVFRSVMAYDWRGNLAELRNTVDALLEMSPSDVLIPDALPFEVPADPMAFLEELEYREAIKAVDEYLVRQALKRFAGNQSRAARHLGMTEGNIRLKMKKYAIAKPY